MLTEQTTDLKCHMQASGVDMTVYKEYDNPVEKEMLTVKPIMAKLGPSTREKPQRLRCYLLKHLLRKLLTL